MIEYTACDIAYHPESHLSFDDLSFSDTYGVLKQTISQLSELQPMATHFLIAFQIVERATIAMIAKKIMRSTFTKSAEDCKIHPTTALMMEQASKTFW